MLTPNLSLTAITSCLFRDGFRLFCEHLLEHVLIEREVGDEVFEAPDLLLEHADLAQLGSTHRAVATTPRVERLLADAHLAADLDGRRAAIDLPKRVCDLLLGVLGPFHGVSSSRPPEAEHSTFERSSFSGRRQTPAGGNCANGSRPGARAASASCPPSWSCLRKSARSAPT